jgi:glycosyltransferase involved in cell wall biosynthesis
MSPTSPLTILIPAYNEADSLKTLLPEVIDFARQRGWSVILVDDGSTDQTPQILKEYSSENLYFKVFTHKLNKGYGSALKTGLRNVKTELVVTFDADGQHQLNHVEEMFQLIQTTQADLIVGRRQESPRKDFYRSLGKWLIRSVARLLMPLPVHDLNSGLKMYRSSIVKKYLAACPDTMAFSDIITLVFINYRYKVIEHPVIVAERQSGKSSIRFSTAVDTFLEIINIILWFKPLRFFLPISIVSILFGLFWAAPILLQGRGVSVGAMLAVVSGLIWFMIGLLAEQLSMLRKFIVEEKSDE